MADSVLRGRKLSITGLRRVRGDWQARVSMGGAARDVSCELGVWQTIVMQDGEAVAQAVVPEIAAELQAAVRRAEKRAGREARQAPGLPPVTPAGSTKGQTMSNATKEKSEGTSAEKRVSLMAQIEDALRAADGPLTAGQVVEQLGAGAFSEKAKAEPFYQAYGRLSAGVKAGRFVKVDKGLFDLAELNPKGAKKRPAAKAS